MKFLIIFCSTVFVLKLSSCISIDCEFKKDFIHDWGLRYSCRTKKIVVKGWDDRKISIVTGVHLQNQTSSDVSQYFARGLTIERFPGGLGEQFVSLEVVRITSCNMRLLLKGDMEHLNALKYLDLVGNKIEKLESDIFENTPNLLEVMLNNNRLQFIGANLLEPLKNIKLISFGGNQCYTGFAKYSHEQLLRLKTEIKLRCSDISMLDLMARLESVENKIEKMLERIDKLK